MKTFRMTLAIAALVIGSAPVLILSGVAAAAHQPSQKHLKRSVCLVQCAAEIAATCTPHHHAGRQSVGTDRRGCTGREYHHEASPVGHVVFGVRAAAGSASRTRGPATAQ